MVADAVTATFGIKDIVVWSRRKKSPESIPCKEFEG